MIFSEEMFKCQELGYSFKILRGYLFDKSYIFTDYVNDLYEIKQSHSKDDPMYLISKLLMNSLYGRFGMSNDLPNHLIVNNYEIDKIILDNKFIITEIIDLNNGKSLLTLKFASRDLESSTDRDPDISIPIAASVAAYARIHMTQFLANTDLNIYYMDTDSIYIDSSLPDIYIGKELGKMKLEYIFNEAIFIAPKVYAAIFSTEKGDEIITKIKGFKNEVSYKDLKSLLIKNNKLELNQDKWFKNIKDGNITIKNSIYTLVATESKRQFIIDNNNQLINTKPYIINNDKEIIK